VSQIVLAVCFYAHSRMTATLINFYTAFL